MRLLVKIHNTPAFIIGYGPGPDGSPRAICVIEGRLKDFALDDIELVEVPRRLRKLEARKKIVKIKQKGEAVA